jgi:hypothetical protein
MPPKTVQQQSRSAEIPSTHPAAADPAKPTNPNPNPLPGPPYLTPRSLRDEVFLMLWRGKRIPAGPMRDPERGEKAAAELMAAFGMSA